MSIWSTSQTGNPNCDDTDGGRNIYVQGSLVGMKLVTGDTPVDYCISDTTLVEYECADSLDPLSIVPGIDSSSTVCNNGCTDGACIK